VNISPILSIVGWGAIGLLGLYIFYVVSSRTQGRSTRISIVLVVVLLVIGLGLNALGAGLVFIDQAEAGVVISPLTPGGVRPDPLRSGIHWVLPFIESVDRFTIAQQEYTMSGTPSEGAVQGNDAVEGRTADGQQVFIDATVRFSVDPAQAVEVRRRWLTQERYMSGFVRPTTRNVIYNATARYKVEEIYGSKRAELQQQIYEQLITEFAKQGLVLEAFQLRNITFTADYAKSIEEKQIAEQNALRAKFLVDQQKQEAERLREQARGERDAAITKAEGDAQATILRAQAEAEALKLVSEALKANPDLLTFRYIEKLAPSINTVLLPSNAPFIIDIKSLLQAPAATPTPEPTPQPTATP
jgi:regulator of protease activity HflC (stomatin/prohibitin superfamily)